mmetsp:Transcript_9652/g.30610  ORF Transcript_9652/g.30610 Transcript_9652/m.30610 type:complete len:220 (-) Transcript_9652:1147-1806(-)
MRLPRSSRASCGTLLVAPTAFPTARRRPASTKMRATPPLPTSSATMRCPTFSCARLCLRRGRRALRLATPRAPSVVSPRTTMARTPSTFWATALVKIRRSSVSSLPATSRAALAVVPSSPSRTLALASSPVTSARRLTLSCSPVPASSSATRCRPSTSLTALSTTRTTRILRLARSPLPSDRSTASLAASPSSTTSVRVTALTPSLRSRCSATPRLRRL